jgi:hypothetical protein
MSAATPSTATRSTPTIRTTSRLAKLPVWVAGGFAAMAGAAVLYAYGTLAKALGVPMRAGEIGARHAQAITPASFATGVVFCTAAGTILAMVLARRAAHPARAFLRTSLVLVAISLVFPLAASHTATATRLTLALGHLIAAAIVIPVITSRLTHASGRPRSFRRG